MFHTKMIPTYCHRNNIYVQTCSKGKVEALYSFMVSCGVAFPHGCRTSLSETVSLCVRLLQGWIGRFVHPWMLTKS